MHDTRNDRYDLPVDPEPLRGARGCPAPSGRSPKIVEEQRPRQKRRFWNVPIDERRLAILTEDPDEPDFIPF